MVSFTPNLNLGKPNGAAGGDFVDISVENTNMDLIDAAIVADRARLSTLEATTPPIRVIKQVSEVSASNTVLQDDDELFFNVLANVEYEVDYWLRLGFPGVADGGIKFGVSAPAMTIAYYWAHSSVALTSGVTLATASFGPGAAFITIPTLNVTGAGFFHMKQLIKCSAAGQYKLQWAQNSSNAINTAVTAGSSLIARRIT